MIRPINAKEGDFIILTKPLGTQVAVNAYEWLVSNPNKYEKIKDLVSEEEVIEAYKKATESMIHLNKTGAELMHKYKAHAATDVTCKFQNNYKGFGLTGHANNLATNQVEDVDFVIHTLPIIKNMTKIDERLKMFKLAEGLSAETSGGLFICLPKENAQDFCDDYEKIDGKKAWIIGEVIKGKKKAILKENIKVVEV
jgi:selenide, water dikinase